jgi:hypothetical protein
MSSRLVAMAGDECQIDWTPSRGRSTVNRPFLCRRVSVVVKEVREESTVIIVPRLVPVADPN